MTDSNSQIIASGDSLIESYRDMTGFLRETLGISGNVPIEIAPLAKRGSDRTFFRVKWNSEKSAILASYNPARLENTYYAEIGVFLKKMGLPVPTILRHDAGLRLILMEDLGDTDLWSFRESPWEIRLPLYRKTLTVVRRLHSYGGDSFSPEDVTLMDGFGPELYRWERDYFKEHFVRGVCGIELDGSWAAKLESELSGLADRLRESNPSLVHRDLQSQNIMVRAGEPYLIDFQGMRLGNPFYDLGSLLCDPYVDLLERDREELLFFDYRCSPQDLMWSDFQIAFWEASSQRLMQALGAYGFLGRKKGMETFLKHIPAALRNLRVATGKEIRLPLLGALAQKCEEAIVGPRPT
jgi:N-acetylmuramate 1-kinase